MRVPNGAGTGMREGEGRQRGHRQQGDKSHGAWDVTTRWTQPAGRLEGRVRGITAGRGARVGKAAALVEARGFVAEVREAKRVRQREAERGSERRETRQDEETPTQR